MITRISSIQKCSVIVNVGEQKKEKITRATKGETIFPTAARTSTQDEKHIFFALHFYGPAVHLTF